MSATILVVEEDVKTAELIRCVLIEAGYDAPEAASSGSAALEAAMRLRPSLVLIDLELNGTPDSIDTAQQLRELHGTRVVYLTVFDDDRLLQRAKVSAPLGYLPKPLDARALRASVEIALHHVSLESALAAREQWFATTLQSIGDAVLTTDADERVTFMNRAAKAIFGLRAGDAIGKKLQDVVRLVDARGASLSTLVRGTIPRGRPALLPRDARLLRVTPCGAAGSDEPLIIRGIEGSIAPIELDAGKAFGTVMVFRDVRERRQLERRLGMTERLAAIGTMASGMQHEINNPLASVVANLQFVLDELRESPAAANAELVKALEDASEGADRIRRTIQELRHFSRSAGSADSPIDLTTAIDDAVRMAAHTVRHHATVRRQYGRAPLVRAEEGQLARVFMNLLLTAARATGDGGATQHTIVLITRTDRDGRAVAEVVDDGPGIAPAVLHRIFDPFFVSAPENVAMGLALAVCHSIVTSLGGEIDVESELGKGTTFRVSLPPAQVTEAVTGVRAALPSATQPPASVTVTRRPRILVIDDEVVVGHAIRRVLGKENDVSLESDARAALSRVVNETFDVVFCNLMMPHMSGMDFFDELSKRDPELAAKVVFVTGGALSPRSEEFLRDNRHVCVAKPFSRDTLRSIVHKMMGGVKQIHSRD